MSGKAVLRLHYIVCSLPDDISPGYGTLAGGIRHWRTLPRFIVRVKAFRGIRDPAYSAEIPTFRCNLRFQRIYSVQEVLYIIFL